MDTAEGTENHSAVWLNHQVKGKRDEAGEVAEARRHRGTTEGFKQGSVLVREGWRLGWKGWGWRLEDLQPPPYWEAAEKVA